MFKALIINLAHREDRRIHILKEITKMPLEECYLIEGIVDGTNTCFQSQRKCIEIAKEKKWEHVLVLEDDCIFEENLTKVLIPAWEQVKRKEWKMFFLGANLQSSAAKEGENLLKLSGAFAAHAYIVHNSFYDTILSLPFDREMDIHYKELMKNHQIYLCNPMVAYQLPSYSDLQGRFRDYREELNHNFVKFTENEDN